MPIPVMRSFLVLAATLAVIGLAAATAPDTFKVRFGTTVAHGSGNVEIEFIRAWAPIGVDHLHELLTAGGAGGQGSFFDGATFFRVVPGFVVQFGLAASPGVTQRWQSQRLTDDPVTQTNAQGTITFATSGPNSRTTQLFINLGANSYLDRMGFAPIGRVTAGFEHVQAINAEYGEKPNQGMITSQGAAYTSEVFPRLDRITSTTLL